jgi:hypothetical protein
VRTAAVPVRALMRTAAPARRRAWLAIGLMMGLR